VGKGWFVIAAILLVGGLSATAVAMSSKARIDSKTTLTFTLQGVTGEEIDLGQSGESIGDEFISSNLLLSNGEEVGSLDSVCTVTNTMPLTTVCDAALRLDSGQITLIGRVPGEALSGEANVRVAVVGGTGAYRHSHGFASIDTTTSAIRVVLTP
jgi:hypothetical protein